MYDISARTTHHGGCVYHAWGPALFPQPAQAVKMFEVQKRLSGAKTVCGVRMLWVSLRQQEYWLQSSML